MGINLHWQGERGDLLDHVLDERGLTKHLVAAAQEDSVCLRFVDLYGDTVFNQLQIPVLLEEIRAVAASSLSQEAIAHREEIVKLVREAQGRVHTYLKFTGD